MKTSSCLQSLTVFDKIAPMKKVRISKPSAPWLTFPLKIMMKQDKVLIKYKRSKTELNHTDYKQLRDFVLRKAKKFEKL